MHETTLAPADRLPPEQLHTAFAAAFADYLIGPFDLPLAAWPDFLARQAVDLGLSRVALRGDLVLAFALVAPRPQIGRWRLAAMGAPPAGRGSGAAPALLDDLLARACGEADAVELEVFAQNERAVRLYLGRGFERRQVLHEHIGTAPAAPAPAPAPQNVDLSAAWAWLADAAREIGDLPLQVTGAALAHAEPGLAAWRSGPAQMVFRAAPERPLIVHSLVDREPAQAGAQALLAALCAAHPGRLLKVPPLQRADLGGDALQRLGFERQALCQWLMRRELRGGAAGVNG